VHRIVFGDFHTPGAGYVLHVGTAASPPFAIANRPFAPVATAAMAFFYQQRSGVPILPALVERRDLARAAGHAPDRATCFAGRDQKGVQWPGCGYTLDATSGWYDAGDQGKYVVNGGVSTWTLLDRHERLGAFGEFRRRAARAAETHQSPRRSAGRGQIRARDAIPLWHFAGGLAAGWQGRIQHDRRRRACPYEDRGRALEPLPAAPADDRERRFFYPPSTAATLNMVGVAARTARI
jgi:endoglucanase